MSALPRLQLDGRSSSSPTVGVPPLARRVAVANPRGIQTYNSHPGFGLDPEAILSYFRQAENGAPVRQCDLFEDVEQRDAGMRGMINGRIEPVAGSDFVVKAGRADAASEKAADALFESLTNKLSFREFLEHQLTHWQYGYACTNLVWDYDETGYVAPVDFQNIAHRRFAAPAADRAHEIWLMNGTSPRDLVELEPGLWAVSRYRGRNPYASGLMRSLTWWSTFKSWSMRDWQVFAEMFGLPFVLGYYEEGASQTSRDKLKEAVQTIGEDGWAVLSNMTELVFAQGRGGDASSVFPLIARMAEDQMAKLILGGTLNNDVAGSGVGSYNAASVHERNAYVLQRSDARRVEEMFVRDVGTWFNRFNGFDRAAPPRLKIQLTRDNLERAQVMQVVGQVVDIDEDQIREEFYLRTPAPGKGVRFAADIKTPTPGRPDKQEHNQNE